MHFLAYVIVPSVGDVESLVAAEMVPHKEDDDGFGIWDWYQIGGRWTGQLSGYDPRNDPLNRRNWDWYQIDGRWTGQLSGYDPRNDPLNRRNNELKHSTEFAQHDGDVQEITADLILAIRLSLDDTEQGRAVLGDLCESRGLPRARYGAPHSLFVDGEFRRARHYSVALDKIVEDAEFDGHCLEALRRRIGDRAVVVDYHS